MKKFELITIFPQIMDSYFNESLFKRAQKNKLIKIKTHFLRRWTNDKHQTVDDRLYGGGAGLLFKIEPVYVALKALKLLDKKQRKQSNSRVILLAANGRRFTQREAERLVKYDRLVFICPRYEGVDARIEKFVDEKISIGDYVLAGGELPATIIIESVCRLIPGFVGKQESVQQDSHRQDGYLEHPQYTRPEVFITSEGKKIRVPKILLSGHHSAIEDWRNKKSSLKNRQD